MLKTAQTFARIIEQMLKTFRKCETVIDFMLFSHWRKSKKNDAETFPKMGEKSSKNRCGSGLVPFIFRFYTFWRAAKKTCFFDASPVA